MPHGPGPVGTKLAEDLGEIHLNQLLTRIRCAEWGHRGEAAVSSVVARVECFRAVVVASQAGFPVGDSRVAASQVVGEGAITTVEVAAGDAATEPISAGFPESGETLRGP